jgi:photosystem II stability/assembly factor-like uncharacterized protein
VEIKSLAINPLFNNFIYAGLSDGRLIKSENNGISWTNLYNFGREVQQILINPYNVQIIYLLAKDKEAYRSEDQGITWVSLKENYQSGNPEQIILNQNFSDALLMVKNNGLFHTENGGKNWREYKLISSNRGLKIYVVAINPHNPDIIYYATQKTIYKSVDGGENWTTKSLPSKRVPNKILIDPINTNILYLGLINISK